MATEYYREPGTMPPRNRHLGLSRSGLKLRVSCQATGAVHLLEGPQAYVLPWCDGEADEVSVAEALERKFPGVSLEQTLAELADLGLLVPAHLPKRHRSLVQALGQETLVYLRSSGTAHLLNGPAARVYQACDGETPVEDVAAELGEGGRELVWLTLETLRTHKLVPEKHAAPELRSRRDALKTLGKTAAVLPLVSSLLVPRPAMAQSCFEEDFNAEVFCPDPGDPPNRCQPCCPGGSTATTFACGTVCGDGCACFCMQARQCAGNDCTVGSCLDDSEAGGTICVGDDNFSTPGVLQRNCNAARTAAGVAGESIYACCEGCS